MTDNSWWATAPERFKLARSYHEVAEVIGWDKAVKFGLEVWSRKRPPSQRRTCSVSGGAGRGVIYIPQLISGWKGRELAEMLGDEDADRMARAFGGEALEFGCIAPAFRRRRDEAIRTQFRDGKSLKSIARHFDLTDRRVRDIVASEPVNDAD